MKIFSITYTKISNYRTKNTVNHPGEDYSPSPGDGCWVSPWGGA
jgi:hypothetical protein